MRKFFSLTLALTAALIPITEFSLNSSAIAAKAKWVKVSTNVNNSVFYVDKVSIKKNQEFRFFWMKTVLAKPYKLSANKVIYSFITYRSIDCITLMFRTRSVAAIDRKGKVISRSIDGEGGYIDFVSPDTSFSSVTNFVCDR